MNQTPVGPEDHDSVSICVTRPGKPRSPDKPGWLAPPVRRVLEFKESVTPTCLDDTFVVVPNKFRYSYSSTRFKVVSSCESQLQVSHDSLNFPFCLSSLGDSGLPVSSTLL